MKSDDMGVTGDARAEEVRESLRERDAARCPERDNRLRALLDVAINGKGAFRRFKDVLQDHPDERERWFAFQKQREDHRILSWLDSEGIEPVASPPAN